MTGRASGGDRTEIGRALATSWIIYKGLACNNDLLLQDEIKQYVLAFALDLSNYSSVNKKNHKIITTTNTVYKLRTLDFVKETAIT